MTTSAEARGGNILRVLGPEVDPESAGDTRWGGEVDLNEGSRPL